MGAPERYARLLLVLRVLAAAALLAVVVGGVARAATQPDGSAALMTPLKKPPKTSPIPTPPTSGPGIITNSSPGGVAAVTGNGENLAGKTDTVVVLPALQVYAYPVVGLPIADPAYPGKGINRITALAWIISNPTTITGQVPDHISYGAVTDPADPTGPSVSVKTLAFGAIPISADLTLAQTVTNGLVDPLTVFNDTYVDADSNIHSNFTVSGSLSLRLTNVVVDGTPLNLPASCTTVSPVHLTALATSAQYQISTGGLLQGQVTIPSFTGCIAHVAGQAPEDIDPLLDGTLSGSSNPTFLTQNGLGTYDPYYKNDCHPTPPVGYQNGCLPAPAALPTITAPIPTPAPIATETYDPPAYGG